MMKTIRSMFHYLLIICFLMAASLTVTAISACAPHDQPPAADTLEPAPHNGTFVSDFGSISFNGDGTTIEFEFTDEFSGSSGLPTGKQTGNYVFQFHNEAYRYDKAEYLTITVGDISCTFNSDFTKISETDIYLLSPLAETDYVHFKKQ